jgi:hypothetical protein
VQRGEASGELSRMEFDVESAATIVRVFERAKEVGPG